MFQFIIITPLFFTLLPISESKSYPSMASLAFPNNRPNSVCEITFTQCSLFDAIHFKKLFNLSKTN